MTKLMCDACRWIGQECDVLVAPNPFDPLESVWGCPVCKSASRFVGLCDEPGCTRPVSCRTSTPTGYRLTCSPHRPDNTPRTLDEFIRHHGLTPEVKQQDYGFSYCIEELEGCVWTEFENLGLDLLQKLQGGTSWSCGKGATEEEAKNQFAEFISGRLLVFGRGDSRRFVRCPVFTPPATSAPTPPSPAHERP